MKATAFSPASIGNVAVGFDILGQALEGAGDRVTVTRTDSGEVRIVAIRGAAIPLPTVAADNTAGRALLHLKQSLAEDVGFDVEIDKGIAMGSGMGGSAASAVAAVVAANAVLDSRLPIDALYQAAMQGEAAATGSAHGDNVGPMLLGGVVIAPEQGSPVKVPVPDSLYVALVHPHFVLETRRAREALKGAYALPEFVHQSEALALFLAGCFMNDLSLLKRGLRDVLVEPRRASLIPGFAKVKQAALESGAIGASISGAGPSVFGWFESRASAERAASAMATAFKDAGLESDRFISRANAPGAYVEHQS
jgi:homoserine kinase